VKHPCKLGPKPLRMIDTPSGMATGVGNYE
jgi:hypothetical protein